MAVLNSALGGLVILMTAPAVDWACPVEDNYSVEEIIVFWLTFLLYHCKGGRILVATNLGVVGSVIW